ncbi:hypothetical protein QL285_055696 [Trifolium repens]|nr:hypothetical protein QL285_055696 [Trifolium repens]
MNILAGNNEILQRISISGQKNDNLGIVETKRIWDRNYWNCWSLNGVSLLMCFPVRLRLRAHPGPCHSCVK